MIEAGKGKGAGRYIIETRMDATDQALSILSCLWNSTLTKRVIEVSHKSAT
jgi:hypothetical protein